MYKSVIIKSSLITILLSACSDITVPVAALDQKGVMMKGTATAKTNGDGEIIITGPYGKCVGSYDAFDMSQTIPISLLCDDNTTALGSATRTGSGVSGAGSMRDSKGREWKFVFGENATALF